MRCTHKLTFNGAMEVVNSLSLKRFDWTHRA